MNIVFFGTSEVGLPTLEKLIQQHQVVAVVTAPDAPVGRKQVITPSPIAIYAQEHGLQVFKPERVKNNPEVLSELEKLGADIFVVVSYGKILPKELIDSPPLKTLNIHFSLLPKYRGAAPIQAALKNGDAQTGTTIFVLDELLDHGPILAQVIEVIHPDDTFPTLADRMAKISAVKLIEILPLYQSGKLMPQEQDNGLATKAPIIKKEDGKIDWNKPAQEIYNTWRAYQPWPGIYTSWNGKNLKITSCSSHVGSSPNIGEARRGIVVPGTVLGSGVVVCGSSTFLEIHKLQLEGKQVTDIKSFINGNKKFIDSVL